jgi:hypothetical protein
MKAVLIPLLFLAALSHASEGIDISREQAASLKTFDPEEIESTGPAKLEGALVKLRFNCRLPWYEPVSGIDEYRSGVGFFRSTYAFAGGRSSSGVVNVRFPHSALPWFLKLPTDSARKTTVVIARLRKNDADVSGVMLAEILGREIRTDSKGSKIIW